MAKITQSDRWQRLLEALKNAMSYRAKPGCPGCLSPVTDERGRPVVAHCSQTREGSDN